MLACTNRAETAEGELLRETVLQRCVKQLIVDGQLLLPPTITKKILILFEMLDANYNKLRICDSIATILAVFTCPHNFIAKIAYKH